MKLILRSTVAALTLGAFAGAANADMADVPSMWNGFYIGGQGGYYNSEINFPDGTILLFTGPDSGEGFTAGGYAGFNQMINEYWLAGIEGDYNGAFDEISKKDAPYELDAFGSLRARIGFVHENTLLFVTGGLALADYSPTDDNPSVDLQLGYAVGAGVEQFVTENMSVKLEFLYMGFDLDTPFGPPGTDGEIATVRGGFAFHF
ncbi:outer membrane beta-barrel protein [Anderseniella sp. Alg231-50]|uniref:outer membrane beta-barrel protein n=1 Tax=Anderseniella sp. Alg231-50 TaxID=1922226 RepID=UPI000D55D963